MYHGGQRIIKCCCVLLLLIFSFAFVCTSLAENAYIFDEEPDYLEPTCTESGYRTIEEQGTKRVEEIPPAGHQFNEWTVDDDGKSRTHICKICGYSETIRISSIPEDTIPKLYLSGTLEGIGKKNRVVLNAQYSSPEMTFQCYGIMTLQGHSTYGLPKKNYTIRFYDDPAGEQKHKVSFRNWNQEHKYILKANFADLSQSRNIVGARIWSDMVRSRNGVTERISGLPMGGAVDGFPISVYLNDEFFGLYTLNLHKDDDLYRMKKGEEEALLICNAQTTEEALFRKPALFADDYSSDWEVEFCGTEDESWAKESFNQFITFVMESREDEFKEHISDYLDVDAAIDYLLYIYALGLEHSGAKDLVMLSYGAQWIPSAYDMDEAFGLDIDHSRYREPDEFLPVCTDGTWDSGTGSLLWDRILNSFTDQIIKRYQSLRTTSFSEEFMINCERDFLSQIPESYCDSDFYLYPGRPMADRHMEEQIEQYIAERLQIMDRIWKEDAE